jgi:hypothetical protein
MKLPDFAMLQYQNCLKMMKITVLPLFLSAKIQIVRPFFGIMRPFLDYGNFAGYV